MEQEVVSKVKNKHATEMNIVNGDKFPEISVKNSLTKGNEQK